MVSVVSVVSRENKISCEFDKILIIIIFDKMGGFLESEAQIHNKKWKKIN